MAGIGFELKKLVAARTLRGILGAAFSGTLVVAGPWLISAASLAAAQALPAFAGAETAALFTSAMVWAFGLSICLSAAPLYLFVRLSADLVYEGRRGEAAALLAKFALASALVSLPLGLGIGLFLAGSLPRAAELALSFALLFTSANALWAATMTVTVVRKYGRVLGSYALGMALMYFLARFLGPGRGAAFLLSTLAAGYGLTTVLLVLASVDSLGWKPYPEAWKSLLSYAKKYRNLAAAGLCYSVATWVDKAVLALGVGGSVPGTRLFSGGGYDTAFYYANLALIPGLVYYTIETETDFSIDLKRLVSCLGRGRQPEIEAAKSRLIRESAQGLARQSAFQAAAILCLVLVAPHLGRGLGFEEITFVRLLAGGFFQLLLMAGLNILFYLELYRRAALSALAFLALNAALSVAACASGCGPALQGLPYLASCLLSSALALALGFEGLAKFDRIVFLRASGERYGL